MDARFEDEMKQLLFLIQFLLIQKLQVLKKIVQQVWKFREAIADIFEVQIMGTFTAESKNRWSLTMNQDEVTYLKASVDYL